MGTKDLTHEAIAQALTAGDPLTHEQRGVLLGLVADDKAWQRECDTLRRDRDSLSLEVERLRTTLGAAALSPFLTDVVTAAGLLEHGKRDKGLAQRMADRAWELRLRALGPNWPVEPDPTAREEP